MNKIKVLFVLLALLLCLTAFAACDPDPDKGGDDTAEQIAFNTQLKDFIDSTYTTVALSNPEKTTGNVLHVASANTTEHGKYYGIIVLGNKIQGNYANGFKLAVFVKESGEIIKVAVITKGSTSATFELTETHISSYTGKTFEAAAQTTVQTGATQSSNAFKAAVKAAADYFSDNSLGA